MCMCETCWWWSRRLRSNGNVGLQDVPLFDQLAGGLGAGARHGGVETAVGFEFLNGF